jgi:hypothetical protein
MNHATLPPDAGSPFSPDAPVSFQDGRMKKAVCTRSARSGLPIFTVHVEGCTPTGTVFAREATFDFTGTADLPFVFSAWRQAERQLLPPD